MYIFSQIAVTDTVLERIFFGNTVLTYLKALAFFVALAILAYMLNYIIDRVLQVLGRRSKVPLISLMIKADKRLAPILLYFPVYFVANYLVLPATAVKIVYTVWLFVVVYCVVRFVQDGLKIFINYQVENGKADPHVAASVSLIVSIILWPLSLLFILSNLGVNITTLLAGLGVGGVAVALASQTILADLFNYFTIIIGRPFNIGDSVEVGGINGTVVSIGLKGTRIASVTGEQVIISNTDMTKGVLKNYQVMTRRRMRFVLGIRYDTPSAKVKALPGKITEIIENHDKTKLDQVTFKEFGDSALNFEVSYHVLSQSIAVYVKVREEINFAIMDMLETEGIGLAFPSSSIYMEK